MDGEFNVFDEWGNYVGKFTPAGSGFGDAIFMMIAMIILWTIGFLIYLFIKLIVNGFKAAKEEDWGRAIGYWVVPGLLIFFFAVSLIGGAANAAAEERQQQQQQQAKESEVQWALQNKDEAVTLTKIRGGMSWIENCNSLCKDNVFGEYKFTNNLQLNTLFVTTPHRIDNGPTCKWRWAYRLEAKVKPGQSITFYCVERDWRGREDACIEVREVREGKLIDKICIRFR